VYDTELLGFWTLLHILVLHLLVYYTELLGFWNLLHILVLHLLVHGTHYWVPGLYCTFSCYISWCMTLRTTGFLDFTAHFGVTSVGAWHSLLGFWTLLHIFLLHLLVHGTHYWVSGLYCTFSRYISWCMTLTTGFLDFTVHFSVTSVGAWHSELLGFWTLHFLVTSLGLIQMSGAYITILI
jgi:hypothetical protein